MTYSASDVFCDWLDVTYSANSPIVGSVVDWLSSNGGECVHHDEKSSSFRVGVGGSLKIETSKRFTRVSASGGVLSHFRGLNIFMDYLSTLSEQPHNVSRLDAALDLPIDGADVIDELRSRFSVENSCCPLGRKSLPVNYVLGVRPDGRETGTFYAGHRSRARQTARVYDKAWELRSKTGLVTSGPLTRYEVTSRGEKGRAGPSLRDAAEPDRLFWHIASPTLLKAPVSAPEWVSGWDGGWHYEKPVELLPAEVLDRHVEFSPSLDLLIEQADKIGQGGRTYLMRLLERRILGSVSLDS